MNSENRTNWPTSGEHQDVLSDKSVLVNDDIRTFLNYDRKFIVVASKGMGKTLLLRYKRKLLELGNKQGQTIVPSDKQLDYVALPPNLSQDFIKVFEDYRFWEDLWEISIAISAIANVILANRESLNSTTLIDEIASIIEDIGLMKPERLKTIAAIKETNFFQPHPSDIITFILNSSYRNYDKFIKKHFARIKMLYTQHIQQAVYIFIDSFDQVLTRTSPHNYIVWNEGQKGLMLAAWNINRQNNHIKVYASVRQEAYAALLDQNRASMFDSVLLLRYSYQDLEQIFIKAIRQYEGKSGIRDFLGIDTIENERALTTESIFHYIYRHSNYTPRSIMAIGNALSSQKINSANSNKARNIKTIVNEVSTELVVKDYLNSEMKPFLSELNNENKIDAFLKLINTNILSYDNLKYIKRRYVQNIYGEKYALESDHHPFCDLYNIGLLGKPIFDGVSNKIQQIFKQPYQFDWKMNHILNEGTYYLLHPALNHYISKLNPNFKSIEKLLVGNLCDWTTENENTLSAREYKIFFSHSYYDLDVVNKISESFASQLNLRGIYFSSFIDTIDSKPGVNILHELNKRIDDCNMLIHIVSSNSLKSKNVKKEWLRKYNNEIKTQKLQIISLIIDDTPRSKLPKKLRGKNIKIIDQNDGDFLFNLNKVIGDIINLYLEGNHQYISDKIVIRSLKDKIKIAIFKIERVFFKQKDQNN